MYFCTVLAGFYKGTDIKTGLANLCTLTRVKYLLRYFSLFQDFIQTFLGSGLDICSNMLSPDSR